MTVDSNEDMSVIFSCAAFLNVPKCSYLGKLFSISASEASSIFWFDVGNLYFQCYRLSQWQLADLHKESQRVQYDYLLSCFSCYID